MLSGSECDDSGSGHLKWASVYVWPKVVVDRLKNSATVEQQQQQQQSSTMIVSLNFSLNTTYCVCIRASSAW